MTVLFAAVPCGARSGFCAVSVLAVRGINPDGIRDALHPRWSTSLCVAPPTNSAAAIGPSSHLASEALRRSRCSSGFVHGPPPQRPSRCSPKFIHGLLVAAALWAVGCDKAVPNGAPEAVGEIDDLVIREGTTVEIALAGYFSDPDGDDLVYSASSSDTDVATVAVSGDTLAVTGVAVGSAQITATASDGSLSATQTFVATVRPPTNREVLEILYDETDGDNWTGNGNWLTDRPLGEWLRGAHGRRRSGRGRRPVPINNLTGPIPPELGYLSES